MEKATTVAELVAPAVAKALAGRPYTLPRPAWPRRVEETRAYPRLQPPPWTACVLWSFTFATKLVDVSIDCLASEAW